MKPAVESEEHSYLICRLQFEIAQGIIRRTYDASSPIIADDEAVLSLWRKTMTSNGLLKTHKEMPTSILEAYGITPTLAAHPTQDPDAWANLLADCIFRIPSMYTARTDQSRGRKILLYEFCATNPYPGQSSWYCKANHGVNDLFIFNPAFDKVPEEHKADFQGASAEAQRCWLEFCHGKMPWPQANGIERGHEPIYVFENGAGSRLAYGLAEAVGKQTAARFEAVLSKA